MASTSTRRDLKALYRLVNQADLSLALVSDPHPSVLAAREALAAALALSKYLAKHEPDAAALGARGGNATLASKGPEYFKRISAMRKTKAGGRPRKER